MLVSQGVTDLGFPLGPGVRTPDLTPEKAREVVQDMAGIARCVLITYLSRAHQILDLVAAVGCSSVQIHGDISIGELESLRQTHPSFFLIKSLILGKLSPAELSQCLTSVAPWVDAFLFDTFDPATGASGATGKTHDWALSEKLARVSSKPVILAGGLNPSNVLMAIQQVAPAGVDCHTGVEDSNGNKDPVLVRRFVEEARAGFMPPLPLQYPRR